MTQFKNPALALLAKVAVKLRFIAEEQEIVNTGMDVETLLIHAELLMLEHDGLKGTVAKLEKEVARLEQDRDEWKEAAHDYYKRLNPLPPSK